MIFFLMCRAGNHTIRDSYLYHFPNVRERIHVFNYEGVVRQWAFPYGCFVFTDMDRAPPPLLDGIVQFYDFLGTLGPDVRRVNHPTLSMGRYELLRTLFRDGINDFNVYRLGDDRTTIRYPVFLRREGGHSGALSHPLVNERQLNVALNKAAARGIPDDDMLIVEWCNVRDEHGLCRKYGAFYVDGEVIPRHLVISKDWVAKFTDFRAIEPLIPIEEQIREEARYIEENPHAEQIASVFRTARIDYGRVDYSLKDGEIRIWEINTNPVICEARNLDGGLRHRTVLEPGVRRLAEAMLRLDGGLPARHDRFPVQPTIQERMRAR